MAQAITQMANIVELNLTDGCKIFVPEIDPIKREIEIDKEQFRPQRYGKIVHRNNTSDTLLLNLRIELPNPTTDDFFISIDHEDCLVREIKNKDKLVIKISDVDLIELRKIIKLHHKISYLRTIGALCIYAKKYGLNVSIWCDDAREISRITFGLHIHNIDFDWSTKQEYTYKSLIQPILDEISAIDKSLG